MKRKSLFYDQLLAEESRDKHWQWWQERLSKGETTSAEVVLTGQNHQELSVLLEATSCSGMFSRNLQFLMTDITPYRQAQQQLEQSRAEFSRLVEATQDGFWDWNVINNEIYWSPQQFRMLGLPPRNGPMKYDFFESFIVEEDRERVRQACLTAIQDGTLLDVTFWIRHASGRLMEWLTQGRPYYDAEGKVTRLAGIVADITDQKEMQRALMDSESKFRQLSDSNLLGIAFWNIYGKIHEANEAFLKTLGYSQADVREGLLNWEMLIAPEERYLHAERVKRVILGETLFPDEMRLLRQDGTLVEALVGYGMLEGSRDQGFLFLMDISSWKQAERALRESEQRFRVMAESMPQKVWTTLPNGHMNYMNKNWFTYSGLDWEALRDFGWLDLLHPEDRDYTLTVWYEALYTQEESQVTHRFRNKAGDYRWHLSRGVPSKNEKGELLLWVGTSTDIHEIREIESALLESEVRFRTLADNIPVLIWLANAQRECLYVNQTCRQFFGEQACLFGEVGWGGQVLEEDRPILEAWRSANREVTNPPPLEIRCQNEHEEFRWLQIVILPRYAPEGAINGYLGTAIDITEQKEMNRLLALKVQERTQELEDSNQLLSQVVHNVPAIIFLKTAQDFRYKLMNRAGKELTGLSEQEIINHTDWDMFPSEQAAYQVKKDKETLQQSTLLDIPEELILTPKGNRYLHTKKVPILDKDGKPLYILGISQDITDQKQNQEYIEQLNLQLESQIQSLNLANKELEAFSYSVSHDLRAPLRTIDGFSQAVMEDYGDRLDETGKRYLKAIREGSQHMASLIDDMLNLSRLSREALKKEPADLSEMAKQIVSNLQILHPERQVEVSIQDHLFAVVDKRLTQSVLENLLNNAWKFTAGNSLARIEFGQAVYERKLAFFIRDNGVGFNMAYADKLFHPFQRLHKPEEFEGNGIGLASVQRIIQRHGGEIYAESKENEGTTFYFSFGAEDEVLYALPHDPYSLSDKE